MVKSQPQAAQALPRPESAAFGHDRHGPIVILSCQVLKDLITDLLPEGIVNQVRYMDYGLHRVPSRLTGSLQEVLDGIEEPSLVVLGYGLCGNGLHGVRAGRHTLVVPRVDDCIALLLGSRQAYLREFEAVPGTYYLSKGWLESGSHPLKEYEDYVPRYGPEQSMWFMDQQYRHYERLAFVAHSLEDLEAYRPQARQVAHFCERWNMRYEEILGSDAYVRRLVRLIETVAHAQREGTETGGVAEVGSSVWALIQEQAGRGFLVIPPGGEIHQEQFIR